MKKLKNNQEIIDKKAEEYQKMVEGLDEKQKTLYAYRKIFELAKEHEFGESPLEYRKDEKNIELQAMIKGYDLNILQGSVLYTIRKDIEEEKEVYKEALIHYNNVLENYKLLAKDLKVNTAIDLSYLFTYMLWNGYFSVNKTHFYDTNTEVESSYFDFFNVIKGGGVCLAYSQLLQNYLTVCNKKSAVLQCKTPKNENELCIDYHPKIETKSKKDSSKIILPFIANFIANKIGDHAVTLIEENNKMFIYDSTNMIALKVIDENKASIIVGKGDFQLKPFLTFALADYFDPNQLLEKLILGNINQETFSRKELILGFENMVELLDSNLPLLEDAYSNIHPDLEFINNQMNSNGHRLLRSRK